MLTTKIFKIIATSALAAGVLLSGFTASATTISLIPAAQNVPDSTAFSVQIIAGDLPSGTAGGALDISWNAADMTLDSIYLATPDPADSDGGKYFGNWDPVSSFFTGVDSTGPGSISGLYVGSWDGLSGLQAIGQLNFTLGTGVSNSIISLDAAALGGTWSSYDIGDFINTYEGTIINPTVVPVPAALWLFGSGLIGLVGVARRRK
jgi:hypothetical protein